MLLSVIRPQNQAFLLISLIPLPKPENVFNIFIQKSNLRKILKFYSNSTVKHIPLSVSVLLCACNVIKCKEIVLHLYLFRH